MSVWQALWKRLLSISESVQQNDGEEHATEILQQLVNFWLDAVQPQPETFLSIEPNERDSAGENCNPSCLLQVDT